jgi:hypothetical protein
MNGLFSYSQINFFMSFNFFFYDRVKRVFITLFLVEKVPLNCTSAIKSLLHASVSSLSTIVQKVSVYCIFHTRRTGLNCCLSLFFSVFFCSIVEKMLYATRAKSVIALDVLSHWDNFHVACNNHSLFALVA